MVSLLLSQNRGGKKFAKAFEKVRVILVHIFWLIDNTQKYIEKKKSERLNEKAKKRGKYFIAAYKITCGGILFLSIFPYFSFSFRTNHLKHNPKLILVYQKVYTLFLLVNVQLLHDACESVG